MLLFQSDDSLDLLDFPKLVLFLELKQVVRVLALVEVHARLRLREHLPVAVLFAQAQLGDQLTIAAYAGVVVFLLINPVFHVRWQVLRGGQLFRGVIRQVVVR